MADATGQKDFQTTHTIVVGAGPAGLAVAACLKQAGVPCLLLEQADVVGAAWHRHYDRLHLHTPKAQSALPFLPFPADFPRYPSRAQMIDYLETYASRFGLDVRLGEAVRSARRMNDRWQVLSAKASYQATNLVVASGLAREPYLPEWPGMNSYRGTLLHSSQYRNGEAFRNRSVLVVGFGNSGGEIAIDLHEHGAKPVLGVRGPVNVVPRELFGLPITTISLMLGVLPSRVSDALSAPLLRMAIGDLTRYGLRKSAVGPVTRIRREARVPIIDVGTIALLRDGKIGVRPGVERFTETGVVFSDGTRDEFDAVILATGYRARADTFLERGLPVCDEYGTPFTSGDETEVPGLYFCGYHVVPTGMLREIGIEARKVSAAIASTSRIQKDRRRQRFR
jgi:indole-3-pyruvate monooxygenase